MDTIQDSTVQYSALAQRNSRGYHPSVGSLRRFAALYPLSKVFSYREMSNISGNGWDIGMRVFRRFAACLSLFPRSFQRFFPRSFQGLSKGLSKVFPKVFPRSFQRFFPRSFLFPLRAARSGVFKPFSQSLFQMFSELPLLVLLS